MRGYSPALIGLFRELGVRHLFYFQRVERGEDCFYGVGLEGFGSQRYNECFERHFANEGVYFRWVTGRRVLLYHPANFASEDIVVVKATRNEVDEVVDASPVSRDNSAIDRVGAREGVAVRRVLSSLCRIFYEAYLVFSSPVIRPTAPRFATRRQDFQAGFFRFLRLLIGVNANSGVRDPRRVLRYIVYRIAAPIALRGERVHGP